MGTCVWVCVCGNRRLSGADTHCSASLCRTCSALHSPHNSEAKRLSGQFQRLSLCPAPVLTTTAYQLSPPSQAARTPDSTFPDTPRALPLSCRPARWNALPPGPSGGRPPLSSAKYSSVRTESPTPGGPTPAPALRTWVAPLCSLIPFAHPWSRRVAIPQGLLGD